MTHLPFIAAAYGSAVVVIAGFVAGARLRLHRARRRLRTLDPRAARGQGSAA